MQRIRALIGVLGLDQHELGAIGVSRTLRDAGMEVVYAGKFNLPEMLVRMSVQEDVDIIGLSCHSWEYLYYVPELIDLLKTRNLDIPIVVGGSVITPGDEKNLSGIGVAASFGPASTEEEIIQSIRDIAASAP